MKLEAFLESLGLLMSSMNFFDGELGSILWSCFPRADFVQFFFQLDIDFMLRFCFNAEVLILSLRRRIRGRRLGSEDCPFAACFASESTSSFPSIPTCPAIHRNVSA
jgi:hypothetical protein